MKKNNWSREETIIAFNVYCKIPFKKSNKTHPLIIKYARLLGRSPSALNMKIGNLGRLDPELRSKGITGLTHGSKMEETVWNEFNGSWENLAYESELLINRFANERKIDFQQIEEIPFSNKKGEEKEYLFKTRINQAFFRSTILSSYYSKCCITGLSIPSLLVASHIVPWSLDSENRLNPRNGLCLNNLHDKAFDRGLLTITTDYKIRVSSFLTEQNNEAPISDLFLRFDGIQISLPDKFLPSKELLDFHYQTIFKK